MEEGKENERSGGRRCQSWESLIDTGDAVDEVMRHLVKWATAAAAAAAVAGGGGEGGGGGATGGAKSSSSRAAGISW